VSGCCENGKAVVTSSVDRYVRNGQHAQRCHLGTFKQKNFAMFVV